MSNLKAKQLHINLGYIDPIKADKKALIAKHFGTHALMGDVETNKYHIFGILDDVTSISSLESILKLLPPLDYEITINYVGDNWDALEAMAIFSVSLFNHIKNKVVNFNQVFLGTESIEVLPYVFDYETITLTTSKAFTVPEGALPHFKLVYVDDLRDIFSKLSNSFVQFVTPEKDKINITICARYRILDDAQDPNFTTYIVKLSELYPHVEIATQLKVGDVQSALLTPKEDIALRNVKNGSTVTGSVYLSLQEKGYLHVFKSDTMGNQDDDDDTITFIKLTDKGQEYKDNCNVRRSVREGVAINDIIRNIYTNKSYQVMGFDIHTGLYQLMDEDANASKLDINFDISFYKATDTEIEAFKNKTQA